MASDSTLENISWALDYFKNGDEETRNLVKGQIAEANRVRRLQLWYPYVGLGAAFVLSMTVVGLAFWLGSNGHGTGAGIVGGVPLASLAATFVGSKIKTNGKAVSTAGEGS